MPICQTKFSGSIIFEPEQVLSIPGGLFGFPDEREFLLLELPSAKPMAFLQSTRSPNLCFISLPVQVIDPGYKLALSQRDLKALGYSEEQPAVMGKDVLCLALLNISEREAPTANLLAPVVIQIAAHRGMQVIVDGPYSHTHAFPVQELTHRAD